MSGMHTTTHSGAGKLKGSETDTVKDAKVEELFKPKLYNDISFTYVDNNNESSHKGKLKSYDMTTRRFEVEENGIITAYDMNGVISLK